MGGILARRRAGTVQPNDPRFARVLELAAKERHLWVGPSGERVTGAEVAAHLSAGFGLLEGAAWVPVRRKGMSPDAGMTLEESLWRVRSDGPGDMDSWSVARRCLDLMLRARTGAKYADHAAWSEKHGRTFDEVRGLLLVTAEFARQYGPEVA